jgi:hypothetical protein
MSSASACAGRRGRPLSYPFLWPHASSYLQQYLQCLCSNICNVYAFTGTGAGSPGSDAGMASTQSGCTSAHLVLSPVQVEVGAPSTMVAVMGGA